MPLPIKTLQRSNTECQLLQYPSTFDTDVMWQPKMAKVRH